MPPRQRQEQSLLSSSSIHSLFHPQRRQRLLPAADDRTIVPNSHSASTNYAMTTSVLIELTSDKNRSNESIIFETLKNSGSVKCLTFCSNTFPLPDFTATCSMWAVSSLLPHLQSIIFDELKISDWSTVLIEATTQNRKLEMHAVSCKISESAAPALRCALQTNRIKMFHLSDCSFSTEVIQEISAGLQNTESLVTLSFARLSGPLSTLIQATCLMIRRNAALTDLVLNRMHLGDDDLSLITRAIEGHQTLIALNVSSNTFGAPGIMNFMSMIRLVPTLHKVNLRYCNLNSEALTTLATRLVGNSTVQQLYLGKNEIDDAGAILFATLLRGNEVLKTLQLKQCNLSSSGFTQIVAGLASNVALDEFAADENQRIDGFALETYLELVRANKGPAEVDLCNTMQIVNDDLAADFALALQRNTKLIHFTFRRVSLAGLRSIFDGLADMKLRELDICCAHLDGFASEDMARLLQSVKENTSICSLFVNYGDPIDAATGEVDPLLEYYLKLNRAGRYVLKESETCMPPSLWANHLSRSSHDSDVLFYFLRMKPALVGTMTWGESQVD